MIVTLNEKKLDTDINLRIGISAGEPVSNDNQLYGAAVNLAARLCTHAKPGSILVAQVVRDLLVGKRIPLIEVAWRETLAAPQFH